MSKVVPFHTFCNDILGLSLTSGQRVLARCVFGDTQPNELPEKDALIALDMFGNATCLPSKARRVVVLRLGRGSGKTTISAAWSIYSAISSNLDRCGPGDIPVAVTVAPDKNTAKLSIRMAREMMRANNALNALVLEASDERIDLRRPDGRRVAIEAFAASRGGSSVRGRSILTFLLDEAEFFRSAEAGSYRINDRDIYGALMPRLLPGGKGIFLSTPWPIDTMMSQEFEKNYGNPQTCLAVRATTLQMRSGDAEMEALVEQELERDPDNARREYFCEVDKLSGGEFFDSGLLQRSLSDFEYPGVRNPLWPTSAAADFAFKSDSSAICICTFDGKTYRVSELLELLPKKGSPLKPSEVCKRFSDVMLRHGCSRLISDGHYREAIREHLSASGIVLEEAPEGMTGKVEVYSRVKAVLHEGKCEIPNIKDGRRLVEQARTVSAKPLPGGGFTIRTPRRVGYAHGDLVSAWTLAVHKLAYAQAKEAKPYRPEQGTPEYVAWLAAKEAEIEASRERKYLRNLDKQAKEYRNLLIRSGVRRGTLM